MQNRRIKISEELYNLQLIMKESEFFKTKREILDKHLPNKFTMADLEAAISKLEADLKPEEGEEKFEYGFDVWEGDQKFLKDKPNLVIQLNLKPAYMNKIYSKMGGDFKEWYLKLAKVTHQSGHPVFPIPGHTIGWARIHELEKDTWLVNEIQEDWGTIKGTAKAIASGQMDYMIDAEGNRRPIPENIKELLSQPHQLEWLEYITGDILLDYEKILLTAILNLAREHGVKHLYMLPHTVQSHIVSEAKKKILYDALPKKFHFNKVKVDMHEKYNVDSGYKKPEYYWYRNAQRAKIAMQKQAAIKAVKSEIANLTTAVKTASVKEMDPLLRKLNQAVAKLKEIS